MKYLCIDNVNIHIYVVLVRLKLKQNRYLKRRIFERALCDLIIIWPLRSNFIFWKKCVFIMLSIQQNFPRIKFLTKKDFKGKVDFKT